MDNLNKEWIGVIYDDSKGESRFYRWDNIVKKYIDITDELESSGKKGAKAGESLRKKMLNELEKETKTMKEI